MSNRNFILVVMIVTNINIEIFYKIIKAKNDLIIHTIVYVSN